MIRHDPNMIKHNKLPGLAMTITKFPWWLLNKNINLIHGNLSLVRYKENQRINKSHKLLTKVGGKKKRPKYKKTDSWQSRRPNPTQEITTDR